MRRCSRYAIHVTAVAATPLAIAATPVLFNPSNAPTIPVASLKVILGGDPLDPRLLL
jgi:hypothetical protein